VRNLRDKVEFVAAALFKLWLAIASKGPQRVVLYYHGIKERDGVNFEKQMAHVARCCHVVKASEIRSAPANGGKPLLAITFDDAFDSVYQVAAPILKKLGICATIFSPSNGLGEKPEWAIEADCEDTGEIMMTRERLLALDRQGFEVLSHTHTHPRLTTLTDEALRIELEESKLNLERMLGHSIIGISYPHGDYDGRVCAGARTAGYALGYTIEPIVAGLSPSELEIGRFSVSPRDGLLKFKLKVCGAYQVSRYLRWLKKQIKGKLGL